MTNAHYTKVCTKCGVEKVCTEFVKDKYKKSGYKSLCNDCSKKQSREYAAKKRVINGITPSKGTIRLCCSCKKDFCVTSHRQKMCKPCRADYVREIARKVSREKSKAKKARELGSFDDCKNCHKQYKVNNPRSKYCEACKVLQKKSALPFMKEHSKKYKKQYMSEQDNRRKAFDSANKWVRNRRLNDSLFALIGRCRARMNLAFRSKGYKKRSKTHEILGCSYEFLIGYIESQFWTGMTWENRSEWHIDHIIPIASAKTEEDVIRLSHYTNLQPLWAADNLRKSNKTDWEKNAKSTSNHRL